MNVEYSKGNEQNLQYLIHFMKENKKIFTKTSDIFNNNFFKVFDYHNKDSQKFLNVIFTKSNN